jgi:hypothetical protein
MSASFGQIAIVLLPVVVGAAAGLVPTWLIERARHNAAIRTRWDATLQTACSDFATAANWVLRLSFLVMQSEGDVRSAHVERMDQESDLCGFRYWVRCGHGGGPRSRPRQPQAALVVRDAADRHDPFRYCRGAHRAAGGVDAPPTTRRTVQVYLSRLRGLLANRDNGADRVTLVRRGNGYQLNCDPGWVDLHRFYRRVDAVRGVADESAARLLREALGLWRGPILADVADDETRHRPWREQVDARLAAAETACREMRDLGTGQRQVQRDRVVVDEPFGYWRRSVGVL